jgi:hypothetical protein
MGNFITNFNSFIKEEFIGHGKDKEYNPEDYREYLKFKKYINIIFKNPH